MHPIQYDEASPHRALLSSSFLDLFLPLRMPFTITAGTARPAAHQACGAMSLSGGYLKRMELIPLVQQKISIAFPQDNTVANQGMQQKGKFNVLAE